MRMFSVLVSILALCCVGCSHEKHNTHENTRFLVSNPIEKDTVIYKEYVCQIRSARHIDIRALEKGYLQKIYVDEGQLVNQGAMMFQIMPLIYQAEMEKAKAEANFAEIEYQNTRRLADSSIVSANELALAESRLAKAKAELALAKAHLDFTQIKAPFNGIVDRFHVREGSVVDESDLITTLSDNRKMWVYFNVPEAEYLEYAQRGAKKGMQQVKLQLANGELFTESGLVETIEADINNETGNIAFRATFSNPDGLLRHGATGNILMAVKLSKAILIPQKATFEILDKKYVYVVDESGVIHSREITVEVELPHLYAVKSGLNRNEKILVEGLRKVKNQQKIEADFRSFSSIMSELNDLHAE